MGVSRQCAHRWLARYQIEGEAGLVDRSSRPRACPTRISAEVEARVLEMRRVQRRGRDWLRPELGVPARSVSRVLRRHQVPYLRECDPLTGEVIRASRTTTVRYERDRPGELVHMDVSKLGRIPDGGGWKAHGRDMGRTGAAKRAWIGFDYVHSLVDDYSRLAYSEILPDEKGATCAGFLLRAAGYFARHGITTIEQVITDNHFSCRRSSDVAKAIEVTLGATHKPTALPLAERKSGEVQPDPASRVGLPTGVRLQRRTRGRTNQLYDGARGNFNRHGVHFLTAYVAGV